MLLRDFLPTWFSSHSPRLQADWADTIRRYHLPRIDSGLGAIELEKLAQSDIFRWYRTEHARSAPFANKILVTLKQILAEACVLGLLAVSPASKVKAISHNGQRVTCFDSTLKERLLEHANDRLRPYLLLAYNAPARRRSLLDLRVCDVDRAKGTVTYRRTKNGADVTLPVPAPVLDELMRTAGEIYLLPRYKPGSISKAFKRLARRLGCDSIRFHDTRHDVATRLAEAGTNQAVISAVLGHRDIRSTARYIHPSVDALRVALGHVNVLG